MIDVVARQSSESRIVIHMYFYFAEPPKATPQEMEAAGLAPWQRDYCADEFIEFLTCMRKRPYYYIWRPCKFVKAKYDHCEQEE